LLQNASLRLDISGSTLDDQTFVKLDGKVDDGFDESLKSEPEPSATNTAEAINQQVADFYTVRPEDITPELLERMKEKDLAKTILKELQVQ